MVLNSLIADFNLLVRLFPENLHARHARPVDLGPQTPTKKLAHLVDLWSQLLNLKEFSIPDQF